MNYLFFAGPFSEEADLLFVREADSKGLYDYLLSKMSDGRNSYVTDFSRKILDSLFVGCVNIGDVYASLYRQEYFSIEDFLRHEFLLSNDSSKRISKLLSNENLSLFKINLYEVTGYSLGQLMSGEFDDDYAIIEEIDKKIKEYYENR